MAPNCIVTVTVLVCVASLLLCHVTAAPLTEGDRQAILHYASKIVRIALSSEGYESAPAGVKRNSGMLDAVMNMPDLYKAGRK